MKRSLIIIAACLCLASTILAQEMGVSMGHDLDALLSRAHETHDLSRTDAILLLESRDVDIDAAGDMATTVHRVVWIGTRAGLRAHADLRIPWNSADSELDVTILRTWRDDRWWPSADRISETAVVETLPYRVGHAPDYATMRETMLLHDGVELPCVMETAYTITRKGFAAGGADDLFVLPQADPAVRVEYTLRMPDGPAHHRVYNGAPRARRNGDTLAWVLDDVPALKRPLTDDPAAYEPGLAWSSYADWDAVYVKMAGAVDGGPDLPEALVERLDARLADARSPMARLRAVTALLGDDVRAVRYDPDWWTAARPAGRIWETGYAHRTDRLALAAALFEQAGFETQYTPNAGGLQSDRDMPMAGVRDWPLLRIQNGLNGAIFYDPDGDRLHGITEFMGYSVWTEPGEGGPQGSPLRFSRPPGVVSGLALTLDLAPDPEAGWTGHGVFEGREALSRWATMAGSGDENAAVLGRALGSVCAGAELESHSLETFSPYEVVAGFGFTMPSPEADDSGAVALEFGAPAGGLSDALPHDIHLEQSSRQSPIMLPVRLEQAVTVTIDLEGYSVERRPEPIKIGNAAGAFSLTVSENEGKLVLDRKLQLAATEYTAEDWPLLRALLLEETDPANGRIVLKPE